MRVLVTGVAGFIGFHTARALLDRGDQVVGVDSLNTYYDVSLKKARLAQLEGRNGFSFRRIDLAARGTLDGVLDEAPVTHVVHLAAQAGVRYAMENPHAYADANLTGFLNVLEACRARDMAHLVYASSSSVYGSNENAPFREDQPVDHPLSLYAATKIANEAMAHSYAHLFGLPVTGLRFFTVYGPWGRPDMSLFLFTERILRGEPIDVFNHGNHARDFTYIDDIVAGVIGALDHVAAPADDYDRAHPNPAVSHAPFRIFNIGNNAPVELMDFIRAIEAETGRKAEINYLPMQPGDVERTHADTSALNSVTGVQPRTTIAEGVRRFVAWYRDYYGT